MQRHIDEELIRITVDLGNDREPDQIVILKGQEHLTEQLSYEFCIRHGFDDKIQKALNLQIIKNIELVYSQLQAYQEQTAQTEDDDEQQQRLDEAMDQEMNFMNYTNQLTASQQKQLTNLVPDNHLSRQQMGAVEQAVNQNQCSDHFEKMQMRNIQRKSHTMSRFNNNRQASQDYASSLMNQPISQHVLALSPEQIHSQMDIISYNHDGNSNFVNHVRGSFHILDPECREKPEINEVSKVLALSKRTGEPIHERLYKQEILSKKIAKELLADEEQQQKVSERVKSRSKENKRVQQQQQQRSLSNEKRIKPASRLGNIVHDEAFIDNPGVRLYQRGVLLNEEKYKLIEQFRKEREEKEFRDNCTFKPQLVTQDYFMANQNFKITGQSQFNEFEGIQDSHQKPIISIEKLIIKDGEKIVMKQLKEPTLMPSQSTVQSEIKQRPQSSQKQQKENAPERLMRYGDLIQQKRAFQQQQQIEQEAKSLDFQPKINEKSQKLAQQRRKNSMQQMSQQKPLAAQSEQNNNNYFSYQGTGQVNQSMKNIVAPGINDSCFIYQTNQSQMPMGDDDDIEEPDDELDNNEVIIDAHNIGMSSAFNNTADEKFEALYNDAKHRHMRQEHIYAKCIDKECTFKPQLITKTSKVSINTVKQVQSHIKIKQQISGQEDEQKTNESQSVKPAVGAVPSNTRQAYLLKQSEEAQVFDRLTKQAQIHNSLLQQKKELQDQNSLIDRLTGQEFFKPQINRNFQFSTQSKEKTENGQKTVTLYEKHKEILQKKEQMRNLEIEKIKQITNMGPKVNKTSEQIVKQAKLNQLNSIFEILDQDKDGQIEHNNANYEGLSTSMRTIFKPLFEELAALEEPLTHDEFLDAANRLYEALTQKDKNEILRFGKSKEEKDYHAEECTFKPKTNVGSRPASVSQRPASAQQRPNSQALAAHPRPASAAAVVKPQTRPVSAQRRGNTVLSMFNPIPNLNVARVAYKAEKSSQPVKVLNQDLPLSNNATLKKPITIESVGDSTAKLIQEAFIQIPNLQKTVNQIGAPKHTVGSVSSFVRQLQYQQSKNTEQLKEPVRTHSRQSRGPNESPVHSKSTANILVQPKIGGFKNLKVSTTASELFEFNKNAAQSNNVANPIAWVHW